MADVSLTQSATQLVEADVAAGVADDVSFDPTRDPTRPTRILTRPGQRSTTRRVNGQTRPGQRPAGSTVKPDPVNTTQNLLHALPHAPNLLVAREGACEGISGQFWYLQIRIEIIYNVVYRLCMFEAFTDMKIRIEP